MHPLNECLTDEQTGRLDVIDQHADLRADAHNHRHCEAAPADAAIQQPHSERSEQTIDRYRSQTRTTYPAMHNRNATRQSGKRTPNTRSSLSLFNREFSGRLAGVG
jgi:hypothetical protein